MLWTGRPLAAGLLFAGILASGTDAAAVESGRIAGRVALSIEGVTLRDLGPIVVYAEPEHAYADEKPARKRAEIRQKNAQFTPEFMAVAKGQTIRMPNDDSIEHNVYSASGKNEFDLGVYDAGETRSVTLEHAGQVEVHCSIHEDMNATVFVSPSPWFSQAGPDGRFVLEDLPPGRYRLRTWSSRLPRTEVFLRLLPGATLKPTVTIGAPAD